jgi:hypothetical protein
VVLLKRHVLDIRHMHLTSGPGLAEESREERAAPAVRSSSLRLQRLARLDSSHPSRQGAGGDTDDAEDRELVARLRDPPARPIELRPRQLRGEQRGRDTGRRSDPDDPQVAGDDQAQRSDGGRRGQPDTELGPPPRDRERCELAIPLVASRSASAPNRASSVRLSGATPSTRTTSSRRRNRGGSAGRCRG